MTVKTKRTKREEPKSDDDALALAAAVSRRVQIHDVRLMGCNYKHTPLAAKQRLEVQLSFDVKAHVNTKEKIVGVVPSFQMIALPVEGAEKKPAVEIQAVFMLVYKAESLEGLKTENFDSFARINGIYNAWPYWREFVQSATTRMGLPSLTLPVFRIDAREAKTTPKPPHSAERTKGSRRGAGRTR